jgi:hypothetical protein
MGFEQVAEVENGCFVGRSSAAQIRDPREQVLVRGVEIDSSEAAQHRRLIQRILGTGVRQVEPMLLKVDVQHGAEANRLPPFARLGIIRLDQCL